MKWNKLQNCQDVVSKSVKPDKEREYIEDHVLEWPSQSPKLTAIENLGHDLKNSLSL